MIVPCRGRCYGSSLTTARGRGLERTGTMSSLSDFGHVIDRWHDARVLCIGDVMLDRFVYGTVSRISPEAPIPVLQVKREALMLGGAGNVARNINAINAQVCFLSVIGDDEAGRRIAALLDDEERVAPHLLLERGRKTTEKTRFIAESHQLLRADLESTSPIHDTTERTLFDLCAARLESCAVTVLSDYGKGVLTPTLVQQLIRHARAVGRPVIVDPKGRDFSRYHGASLLTPNRAELAGATDMPVDDDAAVTAAARHLIGRHGIDAVLVTRSEDGMTLVDRSGTVEQIPATAREVYDVSGAGDTVLAVLAASLAAGASPADAARLANTAAGIVVGKVGTAVVQPHELLHELLDERSAHEHAKLASLPEALERIAHWRRAGLRVGFTNGCFDLLHPGHVSLLNQARQACDRLIVGLNSDASVQRLKGPERPVQNELARALVLSSMTPVDLVVLFGEDTPRELIAAIRPDVLIKGADYTVETVVGADIVLEAGGKVLLAELVPGQSTSRLVDKARTPPVTPACDTGNSDP